MQKKTVIYFVKYPEPGKVKTRLAKTVGFEKAADLYQELAEHNFQLLKTLSSEGVDVVVAYDPPDREEDIKGWLEGATDYLAQQGEGLGGRLTNAFTATCDSREGSCVALGSDTLGLKPELVLKAFQMLKSHDVSLGPARDGGYYLIGMRRNLYQLFDGIAWSTDRVMEQTLKKIYQHDFKYYLLPELEDMDEMKPGVALPLPGATA